MLKNIYSFASSSSGNCYLYEFSDCKILIDLGISYLKLKTKLRQIDLLPEDIDLVLIGHEHSDHIKGVQTFMKNCKTPIALTAGTLNGIKEKQEVIMEQIKIVSAKSLHQLEDVEIYCVKTSHDAAEPIAFELRSGEENYLHVTDTGYVTEEIEKLGKRAKIIVVESNYEDEVILQNPKYPFIIKKRIISELGHLSNIQCREFLETVVNENTQKVCFAHLSPHNNTKEIVELEHKNLIVEKIIFDKDETIRVCINEY